jgi:hypothetical protein
MTIEKKFYRDLENSPNFCESVLDIFTEKSPHGTEERIVMKKVSIYLLFQIPHSGSPPIQHFYFFITTKTTDIKNKNIQKNFKGMQNYTHDTTSQFD